VSTCCLCPAFAQEEALVAGQQLNVLAHPPPPPQPLLLTARRFRNAKDWVAPARRDGLFARPGTSDQLQVSVDPGHDFDLDQEIDGLRGQLGKLKDVRNGWLQN